MNRYKAVTLFKGYNIGLDNGNMYVGVPEKKLNHTCMVIHDNSYMIVKKGSKPVTRYFQSGKVNEDGIKIFPDFWLCYFKYEPYQNKTKKEEVSILNNMASKMTIDQIRELKEIALGKLKIKK